MIAGFLIDTSAAARMRLAAVADRLEPLITGGLVATCAGLDAEALYSTRSPAEYEQVRADRREAYEYLPTDDGHWQRAVDAQCLLARTGRRRAVGIIDLLTAVLAAEHGGDDRALRRRLRDGCRSTRVRAPMGPAARNRIRGSRSVCISWCPRGDLNPHAR